MTWRRGPAVVAATLAVAGCAIALFPSPPDPCAAPPVLTPHAVARLARQDGRLPAPAHAPGSSAGSTGRALPGEWPESSRLGQVPAARPAPGYGIPAHQVAQATPSPTPGPTAPSTPAPSPTASPAPQGPEYAFVQEFAPQCSVILGRVPAYGQQHNLSCEAAATRMVLAGRGIGAAEDDILQRMGHHPDPHKGFRGNVDGYGRYPDLRDYGTYAEVVARVLASYGLPAQVAYHVSDDQLRQALQAGQAVLVWVTPLDSPNVIDEDGYRLVEGEHVFVLVGLGKDGSFLIHDPWGARPDSGRAGTYLVPAIQNWDLFDRMAVVVAESQGNSGV